MREGRGGGKEREAPTHLIENSKLAHAGRVTKNKGGCGQTQPRVTLLLSSSRSHNISDRSLRSKDNDGGAFCS